MKKKISLIIVFLLGFIFSIVAQEKIVLEGDTLITITPKNLRTINMLLEDREWLIKEGEMKDSIISNDETLISMQKDLMKLKEEEWNQERLVWKKETKKKVIGGTIIGVILGILGGILIGR